MTEDTTTEVAPETPEQLVAKAAKLVESLKAERAKLVGDRDRATAGIRDVDKRLDQAERVAKALVPRASRETKKPTGGANPSAPAFRPGGKS